MEKTFLLMHSQSASPAITSIDHNPSELATKACACLLDRIEGKEVPEVTIIPVQLSKRDSTR